MRTRLGPPLAVAAAVTATFVIPALTAGSPTAAAVPGDASTVFINELHYDNAGIDANERVEVAAPAGTDLSGWSIVLYNGSTGASYDTDALSGIVADQGGGYGTVFVSYASNGIQNGSPDAIALVNGPTLVQFLSYEGTFAATNGPAAGQTSTDIDVSQAGTDETVNASIHLTGTGATAGDFTWSETDPSSFGAINPGQTFGGGGTTTTSSSTTMSSTTTVPTGPCLPAPTVTPISEVQGSGATTPCPAGRTIAIEGVVVGDYEGPSPELRGFFVQEQDDEQDADSATSEGIFVFNGDDDEVSLGDVVTVTGTASEFQGQTQVSAQTITIDPTDDTVTPADVTLPVADSTFLERHEGMLVRMPQQLTVTETFQLGRFGQIVVSSGGRLDQPTAVVEPGAPAIALQEANDLNRLIVDDDLQNQNRDPILFGRGGYPLTAENTLRGGDTVTGMVGVMTYTWAGNSASPNAYRLRPVSDLSDLGPGDDVPNFVAANPRPDGAPAVGGSLQISNFNVLNYFVTIDQGPDVCGPANTLDCRGADSQLEFDRQRAKLLAALTQIQADVFGLIELENTTGAEPLADIVAGLNAALGAGTYDYVRTGTIGTDAIKVGIIYRRAAVQPSGDPAILTSTVDPRFDDTRNRPSLAQTFLEIETGDVFTVVVNHLKSKNCDNTLPAGSLDRDQGDGAACFNASRTAAAEALVEWIAGDPTASGDDDVLVMGDLNSYAKEDPVDRFIDAGYVDLAAADDSDAYSYVFDGQVGSLDYALASPSLADQSTGAADHHINADEPTVLDYNTEFKTANQLDTLYAPDEFRTSDHDPVISGFDLDSGFVLTATPNVLRPPNQKLVRVEVRAAGATVEILRVTSSQPDRGMTRRDKANDIRLVDADTVRLRAERFGGPRTYTITAVVTDGAQTSLETVTVLVPTGGG